MIQYADFSLKIEPRRGDVYPVIVLRSPAGEDRFQFVLLLADGGQAERAAEVYALAASTPFVAKSRWFGEVAGREIGAIAATFPLHVVRAAQARGQAQDLWTTATDLLKELPDVRQNKSPTLAGQLPPQV